MIDVGRSTSRPRERKAMQRARATCSTLRAAVRRRSRTSDPSRRYNSETLSLHRHARYHDSCRNYRPDQRAHPRRVRGPHRRIPASTHSPRSRGCRRPRRRHSARTAPRDARRRHDSPHSADADGDEPRARRARRVAHRQRRVSTRASISSGSRIRFPATSSFARRTPRRRARRTGCGRRSRCRRDSR